ncbi:hypothetical protein ACQKWADRAFT_45116 [Trichoderma austrokoningii]
MDLRTVWHGVKLWGVGEGVVCSSFFFIYISCPIFMSSLCFIRIHKQRKLSSHPIKFYSPSIYLKMSSPHSSLPTLHRENGSAYSGENQHTPSVFKPQPQPITRIKQSDEIPGPETYESDKAWILYQEAQKYHERANVMYQRTKTILGRTKEILQLVAVDRPEFAQIITDYWPSASFTPNSPTPLTAIKDKDFEDKDAGSVQSK